MEKDSTAKEPLWQPSFRRAFIEADGKVKKADTRVSALN